MAKFKFSYSVTVHGAQAHVEVYRGTSLDKASAAERQIRRVLTVTNGTGTVSTIYNGTQTSYQFLNGERVGEQRGAE